MKKRTALTIIFKKVQEEAKFPPLTPFVILIKTYTHHNNYYNFLPSHDEIHETASL